jgi:hypothetical protein
LKAIIIKATKELHRFRLNGIQLFLKVLESPKWCSSIYIYKKNPHIIENEVKPYNEKNEKMTTALPTRTQQHIAHIAYKVTKASMPLATSTVAP